MLAAYRDICAWNNPAVAAREDLDKTVDSADAADQLKQSMVVDTTADFTLESQVVDVEAVVDWEKRISTYTDKQKAIYRRMLPVMDELMALRAEPKENGWRDIKNDKKKQIHIETKKSSRGFCMMRASGPIEFAPIDCFRIIEAGGVTGGWDETAEETFFASKQGVNAYELYNRSKRVMIVEGRDFVMDCLFNQLEDGTIVHVGKSNHDKDDVVPVRKGVTRATTPIGGWVLAPDANDPNKTHATLIIEIDFKGPMPDFAITTAFSMQGYMIDKLRKKLPAFLDKHAHLF